MSRVTDFEYVKNAHHSYQCVSVAVSKCNDIRVEDQSASVIESGLRIFIASSLPDRSGTTRVYGGDASLWALHVVMLLLTFPTDQITGTLIIERRRHWFQLRLKRKEA